MLSLPYITKQNHFACSCFSWEGILCCITAVVFIFIHVLMSSDLIEFHCIYFLLIIYERDGARCTVMRFLISWLVGDPVLARSVHSVSVIRHSKNSLFFFYFLLIGKRRTHLHLMTFFIGQGWECIVTVSDQLWKYKNRQKDQKRSISSLVSLFLRQWSVAAV